MKIDDENVVQQLKLKNEQALRFIIKQYGGLISSIMQRHLYNGQQDKEECLDDVLLAVWDNIDDYNSAKSSFKNWIAVITKYKAINYQRKHIKQLENQALLEPSTLETEQRVLEHDVESLLMHLNKEDQILFKKYYLEDLDIKMLEEDLNATKSQIYNRLSRGRKKLRTLKNKFSET